MLIPYPVLPVLAAKLLLARRPLVSPCASHLHAVLRFYVLALPTTCCCVSGRACVALGSVGCEWVSSMCRQSMQIITFPLQERNRKLNAELTKLKNSTAEQQGEIQELQQQLQKASSKQQDQHTLIKQLEVDLMHR